MTKWWIHGRQPMEFQPKKLGKLYGKGVKSLVCIAEGKWESHHSVQWNGTSTHSRGCYQAGCRKINSVFTAKLSCTELNLFHLHQPVVWFECKWVESELITHLQLISSPALYDVAERCKLLLNNASTIYITPTVIMAVFLSVALLASLILFNCRKGCGTNFDCSRCSDWLFLQDCLQTKQVEWKLKCELTYHIK